MSNVLPFKRPARKVSVSKVKKSWYAWPVSLLRGLTSGIRVISLLIWPVIKWLIILDLLFAFLKMVFHTRPASGWYFMAHVIIACGICWFIWLYKPKAQVSENTGQLQKQSR